MGKIAKRVDEYVGERIRSRRAQLGLTQHQLAEVLGLSYQQVQKYETGANRVSCGRLYEIATFLEVPVSFFFEALEPNAPREPLEHGGRQRTMIDVVRNFAAITDDQVRASLAGLIRSLAGSAEQELAATQGGRAETAPGQSSAAA
ncbi:MAG: helix-turn-helix transcriptional regulator [Alphaproteobacteria bacterium]|nr:helix-turn-helix transcriptional regulator [Alphaproteobacteria bacterium]